MIKDLSQSLIAAVNEVNKASRQKYMTELNALNEAMAAKAMKMPKQPEPKADPAAHSDAASMAKKTDARQEDRWNYMLKKKGMKKEETEQVEQSSAHQKYIAKMRNLPTPRMPGLGSYSPQAKTLSQTKANVALAKLDPKKVKEEAVIEASSSEGSHPRNEKEKKLAAMTPPANKITHGDVLKGRGVMRKEAWDDMLKAAKERAGTGKFDKRTTGTGTVYTRKSSTFDDGGKDVDMKKADKKMKKEEAVTAEQAMSRAAKGHEKYGKEGMQALAKAGKESKALDPIRKRYDKYEELDTPGNSTHQCAIHVKSEQYGEGRTLTSQHAEPDADGHIAWYDVMFAEGIKRVNTEDVEVLVSEGHMNHKKKKGM